MRVERKKVITIMKYIEENPNFYFPFKIICKDFKENSDYYETDCLEEIDYKFIEKNKNLTSFYLEENLQNFSQTSYANIYLVLIKAGIIKEGIKDNVLTSLLNILKELAFYLYKILNLPYLNQLLLFSKFSPHII